MYVIICKNYIFEFKMYFFMKEIFGIELVIVLN